MASGGMPFPNPENIFSSWWPIIIGIAIGALYGARQWFRGAQYIEEVKMNEKTILITGGNCGIGQAAATFLARRGAKVIIACRNVEAAKEAVEEIKTTTKKEVTFMKCDLGSFKSIREFVDTFKKEVGKLDVLVNNAGVIMCPQGETEDKFEMQFGVNYLGHFLLTELLMDLLVASGSGRIVSVSANASNLGDINFEDINMTAEYNSGNAYAQSKLAVNLYSLYLARKLKGKVIVNVANPGIVNSNGYRHLPFKYNAFLRISFGVFIWFLMRTPMDGAQTVVFLASSKTLDEVTGKYYKDCTESKFEGKSEDEELQDKLYLESVKWTGLKKKTN